MIEQKTLVMKFGGTSVGSADALRRTTRIVHDSRRDWDRIVVVTSAMAGVTNLLLDSANHPAGALDAERSLREKHFSAAEALIQNKTMLAETTREIESLIQVFVKLCDSIQVLGAGSPRALDAIAALGERMSLRLLTATLNDAGIAAQGVEATEFLVTNSNFQNACPDFNATRKKTRALLNPALDAGNVFVTTGFIGANADGAVTTLGRGGSDYSAAIIGSVLPADEIWIWTDVDGVMTTDPRMVTSAKTLSEISYGEIAELAYYGAKVLHPKTIRPIVEAGIGLRICNTFNPTQEGTRLTAARKKSKRVIKAVTAIQKQRLVTIEGRGMAGVPGMAALAFGAVTSTKTNVPLITQASSEQSICFAVPSETAEDVLNALKTTFAHELEESKIDKVWSTNDVSIVTVVGAGIRSASGVTGGIFSRLGEYGINVLAVAQGSSEVSISVVVNANDTENAVKSLHELIVH
ncbi:MAG: aspartate kinase [Anaerolineaceae bacterium]|nr:aspartate kinase [Anaerolineaceae bacterium]